MVGAVITGLAIAVLCLCEVACVVYMATRKDGKDPFYG